MENKNTNAAKKTPEKIGTVWTSYAKIKRHNRE